MNNRFSADLAASPLAPSDYAIRAMVDGVDQVAIEMERKWGVGRLRLLVSDLLRAKFDSQKDKLDAAILANLEEHVRVHSEGMKRAWSALDRAATAENHKPISAEVWECRLPSAEVVAIVRTEAEAHHVCRDMKVFTLDEISRLIEALGNTVLGAKDIFPGASITRAEKPTIDWSVGDEIPL